MVRKYRNSIERRIQTNLRRQITRAKNNTNPLRIGRTAKGRTIYIRGKKAQQERIRLAKSNAEYQMTTLVEKNRPVREDSYNVNASNMNFTSRKQYDTYMKWHSQTAQRRIMSDRGNSIRQSFRTRAENLGVSNKVTEELSNYFDTHSDKEILQQIVQATNESDITFTDIFGSNQEATMEQGFKQLATMYKALGLGKDVKRLSIDDIGTSEYNFNQWTGYDVDKAIMKQNRRDEGRV